MQGEDLVGRVLNDCRGPPTGAFRELAQLLLLSLELLERLSGRTSGANR